MFCKLTVAELDSFQVLVAILPQTQMQYFDDEAKSWKPLPSMAQLTEATECYCAEYVGNYLYVAAKKANDFVNYRYNTVSNSWETLDPVVSHAFSKSHINSLCSVDNYVYAIISASTCEAFRYSPAKNIWQGGASFFSDSLDKELIDVTAAVWKSRIYVLHGVKAAQKKTTKGFSVGFVSGNTSPVSVAELRCFNPKTNEWIEQSSTCLPHFSSSLFVVNNRLYVAGGFTETGLFKSPAPVEVYDKGKNTWSVVKQKHIPPNNLGAVEIEGRVYFIINKFPVDSGIRIPPEEIYHVHLDEWENLAKVSDKAVLCYLPVKRESLKTEHNESQAD